MAAFLYHLGRVLGKQLLRVCRQIDCLVIALGLTGTRI